MDLNRAKKIAGDVLSDVKAAGKVAALQAKKTKLRNVDLPAAFTTLGNSLSQDDSLRQALGTHFERLDSIDTQLATLNEQPETLGDSDGLADKAKQAASKAKFATQKQLLNKQRTKVLVELGKAAYDSQALASGHSDEFEPISDIESQISEIDSEIAELEANASTSLLSPGRILIVGVISVVALALFVPLMMDAKDDDIPSSDSPAASLSNDTAIDGEDIDNLIFHSPAFSTHFKNDESFAEAVKDKQVRIYGEVVSVGSRTYTKEVDEKKKTFNNSIVRLAGLSPEYTVWCDLDSLREDARTLVGNELAIEGTCWGLSAANSEWEHIALKQCRIIASDEGATADAFAAMGWKVISDNADSDNIRPQLPEVVGRQASRDEFIEAMIVLGGKYGRKVKMDGIVQESIHLECTVERWERAFGPIPDVRKQENRKGGRSFGYSAFFTMQCKDGPITIVGGGILPNPYGGKPGIHVTRILHGEHHYIPF